MKQTHLKNDDTQVQNMKTVKKPTSLYYLETGDISIKESSEFRKICLEILAFIVKWQRKMHLVFE